MKTMQRSQKTAMTRNGKIARLPLAPRQQLNQRLQNGLLAQDILSWLNQLPQAQGKKNRSASVKSWASVNSPDLAKPRKGCFPAETRT